MIAASASHIDITPSAQFSAIVIVVEVVVVVVLMPTVVVVPMSTEVVVVLMSFVVLVAADVLDEHALVHVDWLLQWASDVPHQPCSERH